MGGYENLGPVVSQNPQAVTPGGGNFSADERSYETLVFQQNCPPIDWEMNLFQSVIGNAGLRNLASKLFPSSFITSDALESDKPGDSGSDYTFLPAVAGNENKFEFKATDLLINGWNVRFEYSDSSTLGSNTIQLGLPPLAGIRQDLVIIEVWRALLSPLPSLDNKSTAGLILRNGNAKAPDAPVNVNLADDLLDPNYLSETSRRVQVQYRYRVIEGADVINYADGLGDPAVVANNTPALGPNVDGAPTIYSYVAVPSDPGLYIAGLGDAISAAALGTVDGYMYAVPLCVVFRRNSGAFDRVINLNGAPFIGGLSTRPDQLFCDQIIGSDVIDLRKTTAYNASDFRQNAISALLRNALTTYPEISALGTGGNTFLNADYIGTSAHIGNCDGARMVFTDKPYTQAVPAQDFGGGVTTVVFNLSSLTLPWFSPVDIISNAPTGTELFAVSKVFVQDILGNIIDALDPASSNPVVNIVYSITGVVVDTATITFTAAVPVTSTVYVELLIYYPKNNGLDRNVVNSYQVWVPSAIVPGSTNADPLLFTATSDATRLSLNNPYYSFNFTNREVGLSLPSTIVAAPIQCLTLSSLMIPDMVDPLSVAIAGKAITNVQSNAGCTVVTFNPPELGPLPVTLNVDYIAYRAPLPLPPLESIDIFTDSRAIQSTTIPAGNVTLPLVKRNEYDRSWLINSASGNLQTGSYDSSSQISIPRSPISNFNDSVFPYSFNVTPLSTTTNGISKNSVLTNSFEPSYSFTVSSTALAVKQDADGRYFWPFSSGLTVSCSDNINVSPAISRKLASDFVVELTSDVSYLGRKGTLFLALATGYYLDYLGVITKSNNIFSSGSIPADGISLYKLRGNPIYYRRTP